jgi:hypothetical protein
MASAAPVRRAVSLKKVIPCQMSHVASFVRHPQASRDNISRENEHHAGVLHLDGFRRCIGEKKLIDGRELL